MLIPSLALLMLTAVPCDTLVVCPAEFRPALQPWVEYRSGEGHTIEVISNLASAEELRGEIRRRAKQGLRYVVLVGDAEPALATDAAVRSRAVPAHLAAAKINIRWGSEPWIATDNWYADTDDDRIPDVAVGRLTADSPAELQQIVRKTLEYERDVAGDPWRRRVNFVAGLGGFGRMADLALEAVAKKLITDGIPPAYATTMTYASWTSPYCPDPREFRQQTLDRINEGCLFWVYIGHGQQRYVDWLRTPAGGFPILTDRDVPRMNCQRGAPVACFLACYTAAFDQPQDCLAEEMLRSPTGPVAVLGGTRVTMPYAMAVMGTELLAECFVRQSPTIGEAILSAKRNMMKTSVIDPNRAALDAMAALLSPAPVDLAGERAEHLDLFNLIGDPLLRLRHPQRATVEIDSHATAGQALQVRGACSVEGPCTVEVVVRRDRLTFAPPVRDQFVPTAQALSEYTDVYRRANDHRIVSVTTTVRDGRFAAELLLPATARGACHVRVFVPGREAFALGAADVEITPPGEKLTRRDAEK